jgi:hypothetical protein
MLIINNDLKMQDKLDLEKVIKLRDLNIQAMQNNQQLIHLTSTRLIRAEPQPHPQIMNTKYRTRKVRCENFFKEISYTKLAKHRKICL